MLLERVNKLPRAGGRVWKTGIAITLTLAITRIFHIPEPVFAAIVAIICVMPTVKQTFRYGMEQVQAVIIGALVALCMLAVVTCYPYPFFRAVAAGLGAIIVMWLCVALKWYDALVLAACTVVVIMTHKSTDGLDVIGYSAKRTLSTITGIGVAMAVNTFVLWPRAEDQFPKRLPNIAEQAFDEFENAVSIFCRQDPHAARAALDTWNKHSKVFDLAAGELSWFQESKLVRILMPFRKADLGSVFSEAYVIIDSIHWAANRLLNTTLESQAEEDLCKESVHSISACMISALPLRNAVVESLKSGNNTVLRKTNDSEDFQQDWPKQLNGRFASAMQKVVSDPSSQAQVFQVAKLGVELHNYTRYMTRLKTILLENERLFSRLRK